MTQEQLGQESGNTLSHISRIEKGHVNPTFGNVRRIAEALGVSLAELGQEEARIEGRLGLPPRIDEVPGTDLGIQFGQTVRLLRENAGLSQRRLAERSGLGAQTVGNIERGSSHPMLDTVVKLIGSLGATPAELFEALPAWVPDEDGGGRFALPELRGAA